ncbi:uncharacterized protein EI97DRAFT_443532 [Westerdykella ornata]|uniref:Uncharacterized protein n=1 Tax=Westerdykella ornata TaxID=318751 RepID=A0A6A6JFL6_WESOR|nr:uncharacterized protein EI97DRAFT_443532 [Westerdykella ornata]KAF2274953.1 hypothetical protein EI97DRAFT_443532 [Westerdykella ornata]
MAMSWADMAQAEFDEPHPVMPASKIGTQPASQPATSAWTQFTTKRKSSSVTTNGMMNGIKPASTEASQSDKSTDYLAMVEAQNKRLEALEAESKKKDGYIAELLAKVDKQVLLIQQCQDDAAELARLRTYVDELHAHVDELRRRLEAHLDTDTDRCSTGKSTSATLEDSVAQSVKDTAVTDDEKSADEKTVAVDANDFVDGPQDLHNLPDEPNRSPSPPLQPEEEIRVHTMEEEPQDKTADTDAVPKPSPTAWGLNADLPPLPKPCRAETENVKAPPKLSIPITNGGKIETKTTTASWVSKIANSAGSWSGDQPSKDLRDMTMAERAELFRGPSITVIVGTEQIRGFPKHMFMAASSKIRDYFVRNPTETYIAFKAGAVAVPVIQLLKEYFCAIGSHRSVFSLKLRYNMQQDLAIRRDCIYLGMEKYVAHFTRQYCDRVREGAIVLEDIALIEKNTTDDDSLWNCLCNNLATMHVRKTLPEPEKFEEFMGKHPRLAQSIGRIETRLQKHGNSNREGGRTNSEKSKVKVPIKKAVMTKASKKSDPEHAQRDGDGASKKVSV